MANKTTNSRLMDDSLKALIEKGKKRGYLTYEELNEDLPDDNLSPEKLDNLLMTLEDLNVELIDEIELEKREAARSNKKKTAGTAEQSDKEIATDERRIDDPVRMYLTQMGEIPLLLHLSGRKMLKFLSLLLLV